MASQFFVNWRDAEAYRGHVVEFAAARVEHTYGGTMRRMSRLFTPLLITGALLTFSAITHTRTATAEPAGAKAAEPMDPRRGQIKQLDEQIKSLRGELHAQVDPLEAQIKALRDKFDPQIKGLEEQKKTLVEQGKSPSMREIDEQESSELATLAQQEKEEVDKLKQHFADQRKEIQAKYDARRKHSWGAGK